MINVKENTNLPVAHGWRVFVGTQLPTLAGIAWACRSREVGVAICVLLLIFYRGILKVVPIFNIML